ncbi:MAG: ROK family protein [Candidatus Woesearchaeota archaeon]
MVVIAVDIGGTKIKGAIVDEKGNIIHSKKVFLHQNETKSSLISNILYVIKFLSSIYKVPIKAIGISTSGTIDKSGKLIITGNNLSSLKNVNLQKIIHQKTKVKVIVENDANCFTLAESIYGKSNKRSSVLGIIWGTGIGSGLVINKQLIKGANNAFGEIGKIKVPINLDSQNKHYHHLEHLCGGKYIEKMYLHDKKDYILPSKILSLKDSRAKKISNIVVTSLAWIIGTMITTLNPEVIVLGGGVSNVSKDVYLKLKKEIKKYCPESLFKDLKLEKFSLSDDAGLLGAAYLANNLK